MNFLAFVDWRSVHLRFCVLMWIAAAVLAVIVVLHLAGPGHVATGHHVASLLRR